jgi:uncharacterized protein (DUF2267 family)
MLVLYLRGKMTDYGILTKHAQNALEWINEVRDRGRFKDQAVSLASLRAVLHPLRDNLPITDAIHLSSQLPIFIRGIFFEGWKSLHMPIPLSTSEAFLEHVRRDLLPWGEIEPEKAVRCVLQTLVGKITHEEIRKIRELLPKEINELFDLAKK